MQVLRYESDSWRHWIAGGEVKRLLLAISPFFVGAMRLPIKPEGEVRIHEGGRVTQYDCIGSYSNAPITADFITRYPDFDGGKAGEKLPYDGGKLVLSSNQKKLTQHSHHRYRGCHYCVPLPVTYKENLTNCDEAYKKQHCSGECAAHKGGALGV